MLHPWSTAALCRAVHVSEPLSPSEGFVAKLGGLYACLCPAPADAPASPAPANVPPPAHPLPCAGMNARMQRRAAIALSCGAAVLDLLLCALNLLVLIGVDCTLDITCKSMSLYAGVFSAYLLIHSAMCAGVARRARTAHHLAASASSHTL